MSAVATISPHVAAITCPDELRHLQAWLIWRYEYHDGETKPRKVPFYTNGGKRHGVQGRPEDRNQLTTFDAAKAAAARRGFDGVGLALIEDWGICALDFDKCVLAGGVDAEVEAVVSGTYAEYSPSGEGVRAFVKGNLGNRKSAATSDRFGFETFSTKGFVTFTGNRLEITDLLGCENTLAEVSTETRQLCQSRFGERYRDSDVGVGSDSYDPLMSYEPPLGLSESQLLDALDVLDPNLPHDEWLHVGMALHHETGGAGFHLFDEWSSAGDTYPGTEALQRRWESFGEGNKTRPITARTLVKMANEHGAHINVTLASAEDFEAIAENTATTDTKQEKTLRYRVLSTKEFTSRPPPGWIIKGVLPRAEIAVIYGESGSGKTFFALDLTAAIARGEDWRGHRVKQGRVVYVAAEGAGGFRNRLVAYTATHSIDMDALPFGVIHAAPNLLMKDDAIEVAKAILEGGKADVIVIDTFAQTTPGANENAAEDMGKALAHCKGLHKATGALVVLVHHAGKDPTRGARGWSGIKAAVDAEIEVIRMASGRMARISKQKDGEDGLEWGFDLEVVPVGVDEDGDVITSCVLREAEVPVATSTSGGKKKLGVWGKLIVETVSEMGLAQTSGIEVDAVIAEVLRRGPEREEGKRDTRRQHAMRALKSLSEGDDALYWIEDGCISIL